MYAVIHLPQFALQAVLRHEPERWSEPIALVDPARTTPVVCALTDSARDAGIVPGLTSTQAFARCEIVQIRHRSPARETETTEILLQSATHFSPNLENTGPGICTLDLRGLLTVNIQEPDQREIWIQRLIAALRTLELRAHIGIGSTPNLARYAAEWTATWHFIEQPESFIRSLPIAALNPSSDVTGILRKWGLQTVGELLDLGQAAVADRLGLEALALFAAASTTAHRPLKLVKPTERFEEGHDFEEPIETLEPLLFVLRRFVEQLCCRLGASGFVATRLILQLKQESGAMLERFLRIPSPTRSVDILFRVLQTHLDSLRTEDRISAIRLTAHPSPPEQKQFGLFEASIRDPQQFQETLARLSALLGNDRVGSPLKEDSFRPEAFQMLPPDFENSHPPIFENPDTSLTSIPWRRLRPIIPATVECSPSPAVVPSSRSNPEDGGAPLEPGTHRFSDEKAQSAASTSVDTGRPLSLRCHVAHGKLQLALGPWRRSGHWWDQQSWARDEWDVSTQPSTVIRLAREQNLWKAEAILD